MIGISEIPGGKLWVTLNRQLFNFVMFILINIPSNEMSLVR